VETHRVVTLVLPPEFDSVVRQTCMTIEDLPINDLSVLTYVIGLLCGIAEAVDRPEIAREVFLVNLGAKN
jgi:hypothetical protein